MRCPPHLHPLDVLRSAKVILVLWFTRPAALTRRFTRRSAHAFAAVRLASAIAHIDRVAGVPKHSKYMGGPLFYESEIHARCACRLALNNAADAKHEQQVRRSTRGPAKT